LPRTVLGEINDLLSHPVQLQLKRPEQKSYPHIQGLYLLLRASGLACIEGKDGKLFLSVDEKAYQVWESLNPTERYFALLETWLLRGKGEIVGERGGGPFSIPESFRGVVVSNLIAAYHTLREVVVSNYLRIAQILLYHFQNPVCIVKNVFIFKTYHTNMQGR